MGREIEVWRVELEEVYNEILGEEVKSNEIDIVVIGFFKVDL